MLPAKSVDMVIGWAISHHLKHRQGTAGFQAITAGSDAEAAGKGKEPALEEGAEGASRTISPTEEKDAKGGTKPKVWQSAWK